MIGYRCTDLADLIGVSATRVRGYARDGLLAPTRGPDGTLWFSFQDLALLRTLRTLQAAAVPGRRVRRALKRLRAQLPDDQPLTAVRIRAEGRQIVARDGDICWDPDSQQLQFQFEAPQAPADVATLEIPFAETTEGHTAEDWFSLGRRLEAASPGEAEVAYRRSLELDPAHVGAAINLGRLLHLCGKADEAMARYRGVLARAPRNATAAFNLAVVLEDLCRMPEAIALYERALEIDAAYADAHYNLARLYERQGKRKKALLHFMNYRRLV